MRIHFYFDLSRFSGRGGVGFSDSGICFVKASLFLPVFGYSHGLIEIGDEIVRVLKTNGKAD